MILKTLETFDGRKMKGHPRFSEKERNKDASIRLYISSINTRYSTCHSSEQLFIKDHPANNATYISVFSNIVKDNFRNDIPVNWFLPPNISIPDRLSSRVSDPRIAHSLFLIFVTNTHTARIDTNRYVDNSTNPLPFFYLPLTGHSLRVELVQDACPPSSPCYLSPLFPSRGALLRVPSRFSATLDTAPFGFTSQRDFN